MNTKYKKHLVILNFYFVPIKSVRNIFFRKTVNHISVAFRYFLISNISFFAYFGKLFLMNLNFIDFIKSNFFITIESIVQWETRWITIGPTVEPSCTKQRSGFYLGLRRIIYCLFSWLISLVGWFGWLFGWSLYAVDQQNAILKSGALEGLVRHLESSLPEVQLPALACLANMCCKHNEVSALVAVMTTRTLNHLETSWKEHELLRRKRKIRDLIQLSEKKRIKM